MNTVSNAVIVLFHGEFKFGEQRGGLKSKPPGWGVFVFGYVPCVT